MKVLHICNMDGAGGAAIGAYGLHRAMIEQGVDSKMLVIRKTSEDDNVIPVVRWDRRKRNWYWRIDRLLLKLLWTRNKVLRTLNIFPTGIHRDINSMDVDVVQLHWIGIDTISISEIGKINKPVVWKMPDMWPFSGAEHYMQPGEPERYIEGYTRENRPEGSFGLDLDRMLWEHKRKSWKEANITIVGTSRWIADCASKSMLFRRNTVHVINNPINLEMFYPEDDAMVRQELGIPEGKRLIMFGAWAAERDVRKGYDKLLDCMRVLREKHAVDDVELVVFGTDRHPRRFRGKRLNTELPYKTHFLGNIKHGEQLRKLYTLADVFITAALLEGFGLTAAESLACGTPVVCFDTGGLRDIVDHKDNGYRARCYDVDDLAQGVVWALSQDKDRIRTSARAKVERSFNGQLAVQRYLDVYRSVL